MKDFEKNSFYHGILRGACTEQMRSAQNDILYKTQGIIIKKTDLAEADRLLTVYTKDFGKILVKAKAIKKTQAKLKGHLELFLHSHLMLAQGRNLDIITSAEAIESFPCLHRSLPALASAYYLSELIDKLVVGPEKDQRIWDLLLSSFQKLERSGLQHQNVGVPTSNMVAHFEINLLNFLGYDLSEQKKQVPLSFIQSLLGEEIKSKKFLQKVVFAVK